MRDINVTEIDSKNATLSFQQPEHSHVNGILRKFFVAVAEHRRDGSIRNYTCYNLVSDRILVRNVSAVNETGGINGTGNLNATGNLNGTDTVNGTNTGNGTGEKPNKVEIFFAKSHCLVSDANGTVDTESFDYKADHFTISFTSLLPYTDYIIYVSTCTIVGCGPSANVTFRTHEYSK